MKGQRLTLTLFITGAILLLAAAGWFVWTRYSVGRYARDAEKTVETLYSLMPQITNGAPNDRANPQMSAIEVDGKNFVGIIEVPAYDRSLPIYASWDRDMISHFPCRLLGSVHDSTLIVGGSDGEGQFDFASDISIGDTVYVIDTLGVRYRYRVSNIRRTNDVSTENLTKEQAALTLFAKNSLDFDYTVIYCEII